MFYHVWFGTKYRRQALKGELKKFVEDIFSECMERHNYKILELSANKDHVHMLTEAEDEKELSAMVRTLKAVSAKEINSTPRFRVGNQNESAFCGYCRRKPAEGQRSFWAKRYGWKRLAKYQVETVRKYIRNQ